MQGPVFGGEPEYQAARTVFIEGIIFDDFTRADRLFNLFDGDSAQDGLIRGML
jgi:hypothetical protein